MPNERDIETEKISAIRAKLGVLHQPVQAQDKRDEDSGLMPSEAGMKAIAEKSAERAARRESRELWQILDEISDKLDQIKDRLSVGDTKMQLMEHRIGQLEKIVYGMVGVILLSVVGAILALVVRASSVQAPQHPTGYQPTGTNP